MEDQGGRFLLAGEEDAFKEKAGSLFDALNGVQYSPTQDADGYLKNDPQKDLKHSNMAQHRRNVTEESSRPHRGSSSSLMPPPRRPALKRRGGHSLPEHVKNPSKFTKYSLDDVPDQQLTQKSNTAAALAFLREIDEKKRKDQDETDEDTSKDQRPIFKKPTNKTKDKQKGDSSSLPKPPDPEESTGPKTKPKHKSKGKEIKLSHLEYEDE